MFYERERSVLVCRREFDKGVCMYETMKEMKESNARNVSTSFLPYGGITYLINSFDYPNLLCMKHVCLYV